MGHAFLGNHDRARELLQEAIQADLDGVGYLRLPSLNARQGLLSLPEYGDILREFEAEKRRLSALY